MARREPVGSRLVIETDGERECYNLGQFIGFFIGAAVGVIAGSAVTAVAILLMR